MKDLRGVERPKDLTRGPGNVARALAIDKSLYGADLTRRGPLYIIDAGGPPFRVGRAPRVGIRAARDKLWRFFVKDNPWVSGPRRTPPRTSSPPG